MSEIRVALNEQNFRDLVAGKEIMVDGRWGMAPGRVAVRLILSDIGYTRMLAAVIDAPNNPFDEGTHR